MKVFTWVENADKSFFIFEKEPKFPYISRVVLNVNVRNLFKCVCFYGTLLNCVHLDIDVNTALTLFTFYFRHAVYFLIWRGFDVINGIENKCKENPVTPTFFR